MTGKIWPIFWLFSALSFACSATSEEQDDNAWLDVLHQGLSESMNDSAHWLDQFFAIEESPATKSARAKGRIRIGWEPRSRDFSEVQVRFRIRVTLPALEDRVDLLLSDNEEDIDENALQNNSNPNLNEQDSVNLAFRFRSSEQARLSYRIGAGRTDQIYVKSRYRDSYDISKNNQILYDGEIYYYSRDRLGAEVGFSWQLQNHDQSYSRFNNRLFYRDITNDWRWRHEFHHIKQTGPNSAAILTLFSEGLTQPSYQVEEVYTSLRWRTNPVRDWLYFEVEPYMTWLREEDFDTSYGVALRVEVLYGGMHSSFL